tara:strand:+ start:300 stop:503 length:204 start_codon:yes stop_codon:yes gene_type:complete
VIRHCLANIGNPLKSNNARPVIEELTVFIKVKMDNLNEFSILKLKIDSIEDKTINDSIKIIIEKKYL